MWRYVLTLLITTLLSFHDTQQEKFIELLRAVYYNKLPEMADRGQLEGPLCSYIVWSQMLNKDRLNQKWCRRNIKCKGWKSYHFYCSIASYKAKDYRQSYLQFYRFMSSNKDLRCEDEILVGQAIEIPGYSRVPLEDIIKKYKKDKQQHREIKPYEACYSLSIETLAVMKKEYKMPLFQWLKKYYADKPSKSAITMGPCLSARLYTKAKENFLEVKNQCNQDAGWIFIKYVSINRDFVRLGLINRIELKGKQNLVRKLGEGSEYYYIVIFHNLDEYRMEHIITNENE